MPVGLFGKATSIERKVKKLLNKLSKEYHFKYRVNHSIKGGWNCDFYIPALDLVIECDGCFWHVCPECTKKGTVLTEAQESNKTRDKKKLPWLKFHNLMTFWEHDILKRDFSRRFNKLFKEAQEKIAIGQKFQHLGE